MQYVYNLFIVVCRSSSDFNMKRQTINRLSNISLLLPILPSCPTHLKSIGQVNLGNLGSNKEIQTQEVFDTLQASSLLTDDFNEYAVSCGISRGAVWKRKQKRGLI